MSIKHIKKFVFICDRCKYEKAVEIESCQVDHQTDYTPEGWHWFENPVDMKMTNFCLDCTTDFKKFMEKK